MPDDEHVTYYQRRGRVKPVTQREFDTFDGLKATLDAQGWKQITSAKAAKIEANPATITKEG